MMQRGNRFLDFAEQFIARYSDIAVGFEPAAMLHLEEQGQEQLEQSPANQSFITNLYHIQNIKEENYLFKQNLSFLTQVLENKMYQNLYPSVEKQIQKVIREEIPQSETKIIQSVSEQLVRLIQQGGIEQYEVLKEKILSEYKETSNITWKKQETLLRKIENIWNSSVYNRYETKLNQQIEHHQHNANHYTTLSQSSKHTTNAQFVTNQQVTTNPQFVTNQQVTANAQFVTNQQLTTNSQFVTNQQSTATLQFPTQEFVENYQMSPQEITEQVVLETKDLKETRDVVLQQMLHQITTQNHILNIAKKEGIGNLGNNYHRSLSTFTLKELKHQKIEKTDSVRLENVPLEYMQELSKEVSQDTQMQLEMQRQLEERTQIEVQKQLEKRTQLEVQKQLEKRTQVEVQKQLEERTQLEVQKQLEERTQVETQKQLEQQLRAETQVQKEVQKKNVAEFGERIRELQEQVVKYQNPEKPKEVKMETVSLEYMQEESITQAQEAPSQLEVQKQLEERTQAEVQKQLEVQSQVETQKQQEQQQRVETQVEKEVQKNNVAEFGEWIRELQEQVVKYQNPEKPKEVKMETVSLEYMQEQSITQAQEATSQLEVQKQLEERTQLEVQKQLEVQSQVETQKQLEQQRVETQVEKEVQKNNVAEFGERIRELQEQVVKYQNLEKPKEVKMETVSLEYMQEESITQAQEAPSQLEVQKQLEQRTQVEVQKQLEQRTQVEEQKQLEQRTQLEVQKQLETEKIIESKLEIGKNAVRKYTQQETRFQENILNKNILLQNILQGNKESVRQVKLEQISLEYPTEETAQLHQQMIQMVQSEIQSIPQIPKVVSRDGTVVENAQEQNPLEHRTKLLEKTKNVSEQILLRMETIGLVPVTQIKTAAKTVASRQLSQVLLEHVESEMTTEELQNSMVRILQNYRTETVKQTEQKKMLSPVLKMMKIQHKAPELIQQIEPAPIYYRSEDQISPQQQEKNRNLEKQVHEVVKNLKTIEEKTIVHKERIIEQQKEVVQEVLKSHSADLFKDERNSTFIRGEVQQSVEQQMNQSVGKIADRVYRQLESKLKSERGRRGLI